MKLYWWTLQKDFFKDRKMYKHMKYKQLLLHCISDPGYLFYILTPTDTYWLTLDGHILAPPWNQLISGTRSSSFGRTEGDGLTLTRSSKCRIVCPHLHFTFATLTSMLESLWKKALRTQLHSTPFPFCQHPWLHDVIIPSACLVPMAHILSTSHS